MRDVSMTAGSGLASEGAALKELWMLLIRYRPENLRYILHYLIVVVSLAPATLSSHRRCCGGSNYRVYEISKWASGESEITAKTGQVPESCCARYNSGEFVNVTVCHSAVDLTEIPDVVYTQGCFTLMEETVESIVFVFSVCMLSLAVWLFIMMLLAGYVWRAMPRMVLL